MGRRLGRVLAKAPGWRVDSGGTLYVEGDALIFKLDALDRILLRRGFSLRRDEIRGWRRMRSSSLGRKMEAVEITAEGGRYLFMFPKLRGRPREEDIRALISWLESGST